MVVRRGVLNLKVERPSLSWKKTGVFVGVETSLPVAMSCRLGWLRSPIKGLILDISGVLKDGDTPIPGSVQAINQSVTIEL